MSLNNVNRGWFLLRTSWSFFSQCCFVSPVRGKGSHDPQNCHWCCLTGLILWLLVKTYQLNGSFLFQIIYVLFLDTQVSLAHTPVRPPLILSDFHSVSVSETSQSVETTCTWQPTWRWTRWPTWRPTKAKLIYARKRNCIVCT